MVVASKPPPLRAGGMYMSPCVDVLGVFGPEMQILKASKWIVPKIRGSKRKHREPTRGQGRVTPVTHLPRSDVPGPEPQ